jgi:class 3 adenylate cyclase/tetratricopeptide (TPR) repeat protein
VPICGYCGAETGLAAHFCAACGTPVQPDEAQPHRARKTVSIIFSDLVDSTTLGEELDAESLREVMDEYFEAMRSVLERHGGVVEKFIGDAVMAVFGIPRTHEDDALRAVRAAVEMRGTLAALNEHLSMSRGVTLRSRTGVNTGVVVVGDGLGGQRLATGDAVNVAARLEQAAAVDGIVLGADTLRLVGRYVRASPIGPLRLKGKSATIDAWQLDTLDEDGNRPPPASRRALVGRRAQLAEIEARFARAASEGRVESVLVLGEPGVGKSRLVREIVDRLDPTSAVLSARCRPYGTTSMWPVAEWLTDLSGRPEPIGLAGLRAMADAVPREERAAVLDRVGSLLGLTTSASPLEESSWATARLLVSASSPRPLVLLVEDLHWAEESLLDLLERLTLYPYPDGALILATARSELLETPSVTSSRSQMNLVHLPALGAAESDQLIDEVLGGSSLSTSARELLHRAAEGNPLFVEQALASWMEEGVLAPAAGGWTVADAGLDARLPATVSAIFAARLDRLPADERALLGAASVAGLTCDGRALPAMLTSLGQAALDDLVESVVRRQLLVPLGSETTGTLAFTHACLRDVAYELTLKSDRARLHERFARWVERDDGTSGNDGRVGHHLAEAHRYRTVLRHADSHTSTLARDAADHLLAEAQQALRIGDRSGAERTQGRIVELLSPSGSDTDVANIGLLERASKVLLTLGRWGEAVDLLSPYVERGHGPLLRDLGVALCQLHRSEPSSPEYVEGQRLLQLAGAPPHRDVDALASLAGTWKGVDDLRAQELYRRCLDLDPSDPYALGNMLEYEVAASGDLRIVETMREQVALASRRCRAQADEGSNLPWAFFDSGKFALLLGQPMQAIRSYAKAVHLTTAEHMLVTSAASLDRLAVEGAEIPGLTWARQLLTLARLVRFPSGASPTGFDAVTPIAGADERTRVVMLAGGTDPSVDGWLRRHGRTVAEGFRGFRGVVISGGTGDGVAGLAASLREGHGESITALGYLPGDLPVGTEIDGRYDELRRGSGGGFSIAESLQAWADLIASGSGPPHVRLLGINGGEIAGAEYRVALALGCPVGIVVGSGREADRLLEDVDWFAVPHLARLEPTTDAIGRFLSTEPAT